MTVHRHKDPPSVTSFWEPISVPIDGVRFVRTRHVVTRNGFTTEIFRSDWPQIGYDARHVMMNRWDKPIVSDWHCHRVQTDHVMVICGRVLIGLYDDREDSPSRGKTMVARSDWVDPQLVVIPPGVFHAFKVLAAPALMLNTVTHTYDYGNPDHWRLTGTDKADIPLSLADLE